VLRIFFGAADGVFLVGLYAALKRRSSTVLPVSYLAFEVSVTVKVKGSGLGRPLYIDDAGRRRARERTP
jgi:hypothetical protein